MLGYLKPSFQKENLIRKTHVVDTDCNRLTKSILKGFQAMYFNWVKFCYFFKSTQCWVTLNRAFRNKILSEKCVDTNCNRLTEPILKGFHAMYFYWVKFCFFFKSSHWWVMFNRTFRIKIWSEKHMLWMLVTIASRSRFKSFHAIYFNWEIFWFFFFSINIRGLLSHDALLMMKQLKMEKITYNEIIESNILLCAMTWETFSKRKQTDRLENFACILFIFSYK